MPSFNYDIKFRILYITIKKSDNAYGDEIGNGVILMKDIDTDEIVGVTIMF